MNPDCCIASVTSLQEDTTVLRSVHSQLPNCRLRSSSCSRCPILLRALSNMSGGILPRLK